jgi:hypothetical protein
MLYQIGSFPKKVIDSFCEANNLSVRERNILTLRFCDGFEHKSIARQMRVTLDAHYQRLRSIYKNLRITEDKEGEKDKKGKEKVLLSILQKEGVAWDNANRLECILYKITNDLGAELRDINNDQNDEFLDKSDRHISEIKKNLSNSNLPQSEQSEILAACVKAVLNELSILSPQIMISVINDVLNILSASLKKSRLQERETHFTENINVDEEIGN